MIFAAAVDRLEQILQHPLPGSSAQALMAPRPRREWPPGFDPARIRHAAGLLLLYPVGDRASIILTLRADTLRHGGQVSLPGGVTEPGETAAEAALREAGEEIGLREPVCLLGALSPLDIPVSGFRLHPVVAAVPRRPAFAPADREVARILEVSVAELADPSRRTVLSIEREGRDVRAPAFQVAGTTVWGATAMVLAEFLLLLGWQLGR